MVVINCTEPHLFVSEHEITGENLEVSCKDGNIQQIFSQLNRQLNYKRQVEILIKNSQSNPKEPDQPAVSKDSGEPNRKRKWHERKYGWLPNARSSDGLFFMKVLDEMYPSVGHMFPDPDSFKTRFDTEKRRQWEIRKCIVKIEKSLEHITSNSPNAAGKYLDESKPYSAKPTDVHTLEFNLSGLKKNLTEIEKLEDQVKEHTDKMMDGDRLKKRHDKYARSVNTTLITEILEIKDKIQKMLKVLNEIHSELSKKLCRNLLDTTDARRAKENRRKSRKRKRTTLFHKLVYVDMLESLDEKVPVTMVDLDMIKNMPKEDVETLMGLAPRFDDHALQVFSDILSQVR